MSGAEIPKITGLLHNCALNCALPILLDGIDALAELESKDQLTAIKDEPLVKSYDILKNQFSNYYLLPEQFSYQQFSLFLNEYEFSFYAKEMIFAPVFRAFMAAQCSEKDDVNSISTIRNDGSYVDLHHNEAYQLFYKHFGIHIKVYEFIDNKNSNKAEDNYDEVPYKPTAIINNYPFGNAPNISLYLKNDHYELQPHEDLINATVKYEDEIQELFPKLRAAHEALHFSVSQVSTQMALAKLRPAITAMIKEPLHLLNESMDLRSESSMESNESSHKPSQFRMFSQNTNKAQQLWQQVESLTLDFPNANNPINKLIRQYFGFQTQEKSTLGGIFGAYLKERSRTFELRDYFSQCLACFLGCFGYQTEAQEREHYLYELLATLQNTPDIDSIGDVSDKISEGKEAFFPRADTGRDYNKSLSAKLTRLEADLFDLVINQQENNNFEYS
jgi:hypothetical protein